MKGLLRTLLTAIAVISITLSVMITPVLLYEHIRSFPLPPDDDPSATAPPPLPTPTSGRGPEMPTITPLPYPGPETQPERSNPRKNNPGGYKDLSGDSVLVAQDVGSVYVEGDANVSIPPNINCSFPTIAWSPVDVWVPSDGIVTNVTYSAFVGFDSGTYTADLQLYLANENLSLSVFDCLGSPTGSDGNCDDDEGDNFNIDLVERSTTAFNGQYVNGTWSFGGENCSLSGRTTLWWWAITIDYVTGPSLTASPSRLVYSYDLSQPQTVQDQPGFLPGEILAAIGETGTTRVVVMTDQPPPDDALSVFSSGYAVEVDAARYLSLALDPRKTVYPDYVVSKSLHQSVPIVKAPEVWSMGFTGDGVAAGVIDTGIDTDHPDLVDDYVAGRCYGSCPNGVEDGDGHGTAVAGIISSSGRNNLADYGVAPDAEIVACKALDDNGSGYMSDITACIEWITSVSDRYNVRVINMSLGGGQFQATCDSAIPYMTNAVRSAKNAGILTVAASGNEAAIGMSAPACIADVMSVGATYDASLGSVNYGICSDPVTARDMPICYSNVTTFLDIYGPSGNIKTDNIGGGTWSGFAGTSAASPHVAGAAILGFDANPSLDPDLARERMVAGGDLIWDARIGRYFPRVNALGAVLLSGFYLSNTGTGDVQVDSIHSDVCWMTVQDSQFTLTPGERRYVSVDVQRCVGAGEYDGSLSIQSNAGDFVIPAHLSVTGDGPVVTPTATATGVPTETATGVPTETATSEPTEIPEVTHTPTPDPGVCPTPDPGQCCCCCSYIPRVDK